MECKPCNCIDYEKLDMSNENASHAYRRHQIILLDYGTFLRDGDLSKYQTS
ncbi:uncharacterized protein METZ01_LOCUS166126 [marine metagenome]|uniref:Uncharacterized protein n=1 Tax=marine metagenome TaxID=408172 RepID=A0A382BJ20_9ZZZZ